MTSKGGPKTAEGKLVSSQNSRKHGLTAKKWLNEEEQEIYINLLEGLKNDYKPSGMLEELLIERIAACQTRLERIHRVEDSAYYLIRRQSNDPERFIKDFGIKNQKIIDEFSALLVGGKKPADLIERSKLAMELIQVNTHKISGWQYVSKEMPEFKRHIVNAALRENLEIKQYLEPYGKRPGDLPSIRLIIRTANEEEQLPSEEEIEKSGMLVPDSTLQNYAEHLLSKVGKHEAFKEIVFAYMEYMDERRDAITPSKEELDKIHRARTSDERLLSRSIGELLELQERRARQERQQSRG